MIANIKHDVWKLNGNVKLVKRVCPCQIIASLQNDAWYAKCLFDKEMNFNSEEVLVKVFCVVVVYTREINYGCNLGSITMQIIDFPQVITLA